MVKAGILEIADILVVNKADAPGSDKMMRGLAEMVAHAARADQWPVPVVTTEAISGEGIERLLAAIQDHCGYRRPDPAAARARRRRQVRAAVLALGEAALRHRVQVAQTT